MGKKLKKEAKCKIRKFEELTHELPSTNVGITYVHLLEITQAMYVLGKYDLVSGICDAVVKNGKEV